jgi:hypothetical protein
MKTLVIRIATLVAAMGVACSGAGGSSSENDGVDAGLD